HTMTPGVSQTIARDIVVGETTRELSAVKQHPARFWYRFCYFDGNQTFSWCHLSVGVVIAVSIRTIAFLRHDVLFSRLQAISLAVSTTQAITPAWDIPRQGFLFLNCHNWILV